MNPAPASPPVRLSTGAMWAYKLLLPAVIGLVPLTVIVIATVSTARGDMPGREAVAAVAIALLGGLLGGALWWALLRPLADEVTDHGDHLLVRHGARSFRLPFTVIAAVEGSVLLNPPIITLTLHEPVDRHGAFRFVPRFRLLSPFQAHPLAARLQERISARPPARRV